MLNKYLLPKLFPQRFLNNFNNSYVKICVKISKINQITLQNQMK